MGSQLPIDWICFDEELKQYPPFDVDTKKCITVDKVQDYYW